MKNHIEKTRPLQKDLVRPGEVSFFNALIHGDIFVKLSTVIMGLGYARRGKYLHAIAMTVLEILFACFCAGFGATYLKDLGTLGTKVAESYFDVNTFKNVWR